MGNCYLQYNSKVYILGREWVLIGGRFNKKIIADVVVLEIIRMAGYATEEKEIIRHIGKKYSMSDDKVLDILNTLVEKGFLIKNHIKVPTQNYAMDSRKIEYMGIITCEREQALKKSLGSYIRNAQKNAHDITYVVIDDSSHNAQCSNINTIKYIAQEQCCKVGYMGFKERKKMVDLLCQHTTVSREIILYAFLPNMTEKWKDILFTAGAARNCLNAVSPYDKYIVIDDDSLPLGNYSERERKIAFSQGQGIAEHHYGIGDRLSNANIDLIELNNMYLGKKLKQILSNIQEVNINDYANDTKILLDQLDIYKESNIAVTTNTIQGIRDISVDTLLFSEQEKNTNWYIEKMKADYICSNPFLLTTTATGIDPIYFKIPFIPICRNEDVITGMIFNFLDGFALGVSINSNLTHAKAGGYTAIKNSQSNFYEEILYPILLKNILLKMQMNVPNVILPISKKIAIFKQYIVAVCGKSPKEMFSNITSMNSTIMEVCFAKIQEIKSPRKEKWSYVSTYPDSIDEILKSKKLADFRNMLLDYVELLEAWEELLHGCNKIKEKELFPITIYGT